MRLGAVVSAY